MVTHKYREAVLLFDGVCNLCNGFVQFTIKRDPSGYYQFASLQSAAGQELLIAHHVPTDVISTVVLIENGRIYTHSDVALRMVRRFGGLWPLLTAFSIIPKPVRDAIYNWIAHNRYRWFGQRDSCMVPTPELKSRFLV